MTIEIDITFLDMFCDFEPVENSKTEFKCKHCTNIINYSLAETGLPQIPCIVKLSKGIDIEDIKFIRPSIFTRIKNFLKALWSHLTTGAKRTSLEERQNRLAICTDCEHYDGVACTQCGCPITRHQQFVSKLDWKEQSCPVGKW